MKNFIQSARLSRVAILAAAAALALCSSTIRSYAPPLSISDLNSSALIDPSSQAGMYNWTVDGQNQLAKQWFWYRLGATAESSIDSLFLSSASNPTVNSARLIYTHALFTLQVDYLLTGGTSGSGLSTINESISIHNTSGNSLDFHFFQYSDFNLGGPGADDVLLLDTNNFGLFNLADQIDGGVFHFQETAVTPGANHGEAAITPTTLTKLNDLVPTTLSDAFGPVGPGDVSWGFQWDVTINPDDTWLLSKLKYIELVPEPSTAAIGLLGLAAINLIRRRRS